MVLDFNYRDVEKHEWNSGMITPKIDWKSPSTIITSLAVKCIQTPELIRLRERERTVLASFFLNVSQIPYSAMEPGNFVSLLYSINIYHFQESLRLIEQVRKLLKYLYIR